jgi:lipoprotein signal peptidase
MNAACKRPYLWLVGLMALVGLAADQASKYVVFTQLYPGGHHEIVAGNFELRAAYTHVVDPGDQPLSFLRTISGERLPHVNKGALFGIGNGDGVQDGGEEERRENTGWNTFFACVSLAAALFIVFWVSRPAVAQDRFLCLALGLILAGTLGNLYDRIVFSGVRDFLHCYYATIDAEGKSLLHNWPDFNIADCCLVCGAGILLIHSFFVGEMATEPAQAEVAAQPATPLQTTTPAGGV